MKFSHISRNGQLKITFDQDMIIPDFITSPKTGRNLAELGDLDASQFFECQIEVNSEEKKSDLNYFYRI